MRTRGSLRVAAVQAAGLGDADVWDLRPVLAALRAAAEAGAELVVLPELATTPYFAGRPAEECASWARPVTSPEIAAVAALGDALGLVVVLPFFELDPAGTRHNAAAVLAGGEVVPSRDAGGGEHPVSRKIHLPVGDEPAPGFDEAAHFTPSSWIGVHDLDGWSLAVIICYDRRFPECWRAARALGADVVAVPVAGAGADPEGFFLAELRTHARENGVHAVAASRVGPDRTGGALVPNVGEGHVVGADGSVLASRGPDEGPGIVWADLDMDLARVRGDITLFDERRLDVLVDPWCGRSAGVDGLVGHRAVAS